MEENDAGSNDGVRQKREPTEDELTEERKKRRSAILAKYHAAEPRDAAILPPSSPLRLYRAPPVVEHQAQQPGLRLAGKQAHVPVSGTEQASKEHRQSPAPSGESGNDGDEDDMFAENFRQDKLIQSHTGAKDLATDSWDDVEGYYMTSIGELIQGRYEVKAILGRGVFGSVVRATNARSTDGHTDVAIKIVRKNMQASGLKELSYLTRCMEADPESRKHVIRLLDHFEYRKHLCLVVELFNVNLRDLLKKFGKHVGINIKAVKSYATQIFYALSLLAKCKIIHADIKPDNILVSANHAIVKLCDLGTALDADEIGEDTRTPYLVSRYYRAPEIILGMRYDYGVDMWSVGCTLFELYTGRILFPGRSNSEMLKYMMDYKGKFPHKVLRRGKESYKYFDENDNFSFTYRTRDSINDQELVAKLNPSQPTKDLKSTLLSASLSEDPMESQMVVCFADLLEKCLALNPEKRLTWKEALKHPFIQGT